MHNKKISETCSRLGSSALNSPQSCPQKTGADNILKNKEAHGYCVTAFGYECRRIRMGNRTSRTYHRCSYYLVQAGSVNT